MENFMERLPANTWEWFVSVSYTLAPWLLLWAFGKHQRFKQAVCGGLLFALIAFNLDEYGVSLGLWWYPEEPVPFLTSNWLWNVVGAAGEAILICEIALAQAQRTWFWILGLATANAGAEYFALKFTNLMDYPHWSPMLSWPVYVIVFWIVVSYVRWLWRVPAWTPPET